MAITSIADIANTEVRLWFENFRKTLEKCAARHDFAGIAWSFAQLGVGPQQLAAEEVREAEEHLRTFPTLRKEAEENLLVPRFIAENEGKRLKGKGVILIFSYLSFILRRLIVRADCRLIFAKKELHGEWCWASLFG